MLGKSLDNIHNIYTNPRLYGLLRAKPYQPSTGLTSTSFQTKVKNHVANYAVICIQHIEFPIRCWLSRPGLPLQTSGYQIPHDADLAQVRPSRDLT